jgi:hypothetical protein
MQIKKIEKEKEEIRSKLGREISELTLQNTVLQTTNNELKT